MFIKEFFTELKAFIKEQWHESENSLYQDLRYFLNGVLASLVAENVVQKDISGTQEWMWKSSSNMY